MKLFVESTQQKLEDSEREKERFVRKMKKEMKAVEEEMGSLGNENKRVRKEIDALKITIVKRDKHIAEISKELA